MIKKNLGQGEPQYDHDIWKGRNSVSQSISHLKSFIDSNICFGVAGHILLAMSCTEILLDIYNAIGDNFLGNC